MGKKPHPPGYWTEQKGAKWGLTPPAGARHGQQSWAAKVYGCDCKECLPSGERIWRSREDRDRPLAHGERQRRLRQKKRGQPVPPNVKHGIYANRTYGCICEICTAAKKKNSHRKSNPWMYRPTRGHWSTGRNSSGAPVDLIWWPPLGAATEDCPFEKCFHVDHKENCELGGANLFVRRV